MLCMGSELECVTSDSVHCKLDFLFHDGPLHSNFNAVEDALRVCWINLLPDQECSTTKSPAVSIWVGDTVLDERLEHCFVAQDEIFWISLQNLQKQHAATFLHIGALAALDLLGQSLHDFRAEHVAQDSNHRGCPDFS